MRIDTWLQNVVLVHDVVEEVTIVELVLNFIFNFFWQFLEPLELVTWQRNVERQDFNVVVLEDFFITNGNASRDITVGRNALSFFVI